MRLESLRSLLEDVKSDAGWLDRSALAQAIDNNELSLVFQPKFQLPEGGRFGRLWDAFIGFESLVRWNHPTRGNVPPAEFIPYAESSGLMDRLTLVIFKLAVRQVQAWNGQGRTFSVSVNVSAANLYDGDIVDVLAKQCRKAGVSPSQIIIELTETAAMGDAVRAMDVLTRLRIKGFKLSMDDFGTGYSSFIQLQRMPFSEIKIDQEFVKQCHESQQSRIIVKTMIDVAHNLSLTAVAEGVENDQVLHILEEYKCDVVQGYLTGRPAVAEHCQKWLQDTEGATATAVSPAA